MRLVRSLALWGLLLAALAPSGAGAASFNFFSGPGGIGPSGGIVGPATKYPWSVEVGGLSGNLTKVTATMIGFLSGRSDDIDMLLVSPEGDSVMLMSDACGETPFSPAQTWTFDDDAPSTLSDNGPCSVPAPTSFKPADFVGNPPEPDQFGVGGTIFPPFPTTLATFAGNDPNGSWDLYVKDDQEGVAGFEIASWALTLTVEPPVGPPAPPPSTPSTPTTTTSSSTTTQSAPTATAKTGKRAAAMAKCKLKKTKAKRVRCRAKARKLPV